MDISQVCKERNITGGEVRYIYINTHTRTHTDVYLKSLVSCYCCFVFLKVAEELRENVYKATGLTCSAGVAPNRLLAKVFVFF